MRILFDQGTPVPLRKHLTGHFISTAHEMGWSLLANGDLLASAEAAVLNFLSVPIKAFVINRTLKSGSLRF